MKAYRVWMIYPNGSASLSSVAYEKLTRAEAELERLREHDKRQGYNKHWRHEIREENVPGKLIVQGETLFCDFMVFGENRVGTRVQGNGKVKA
jgi:hypothetical protein